MPDAANVKLQEHGGIPVSVVIISELPALSITLKGNVPGGVADGVLANVVYTVDVVPLQIGGKHWPRKQLLQSVTTADVCH